MEQNSLTHRKRAKIAPISVPQEAGRDHRRPDHSLPIVLSVISLVVSVFALAFVARTPEHSVSTRTQVETKILDHETKTPLFSVPKELYGVHLIPSQETHTYTDSESSSDGKVADSNVAAIVHGNLIVVGDVIKVSANQPSPQASVTHSSAFSEWHGGADSHKDSYGSNSIGTCAVGLVDNGIRTYTRCTGCTRNEFLSERGMCCLRPRDCIRETEYSCSLKNTEEKCESANCEWTEDGEKLINSGFDSYYSKCSTISNA